MSEKSYCPICASDKVEFFLERKSVPVHQNLIFKTPELAIKTNRGNLKLLFCCNCSFVFNSTFDINKLDYGDDYDNCQTFSSYFKSYTDDLITYIIKDKNLKNSTIVEVGCGNGYFIEKMIKFLDNNNIGYGFDPSYVGELEKFEGRLKFEKTFYDSRFSNIKADLVFSRHVIEHVPEPFEFIMSIKEALNSNTKVFLETPCVNWILNNKVVFDFFYEHCSYFSEFSMQALFKRAEMSLDSVKNIFGEQYLWVEASNSKSIINTTNTNFNLNSFKILINDFITFQNTFIDYWKIKLNELKKLGNIAIWGAGAKGVTFLNLIDPNKEYISYVIDLNPSKQNNYIAGTGHKIIEYKKIRELDIKNVIVMNKNYLEENKLLLEKENITINLFSL